MPVHRAASDQLGTASRPRSRLRPPRRKPSAQIQRRPTRAVTDRGGTACLDVPATLSTSSPEHPCRTAKAARPLRNLLPNCAIVFFGPPPLATSSCAISQTVHLGTGAWGRAVSPGAGQAATLRRSHSGETKAVEQQTLTQRSSQCQLCGMPNGVHAHRTTRTSETSTRGGSMTDHQVACTEKAFTRSTTSHHKSQHIHYEASLCPHPTVCDRRKLLLRIVLLGATQLLQLALELLLRSATQLLLRFSNPKLQLAMHGLELLQCLQIFVNAPEPSGLAATKLMLHSKDDHCFVILDFVHRRQLGLDVRLGHRRRTRVQDVNHELAPPQQGVGKELAGADRENHDCTTQKITSVGLLSQNGYGGIRH
mmetsp:Transcript_1376/g.2771  ORF Transcript_1376/g.2771 Transcript_1376/m.2771 type:complete len:366 (-) Transcript_1376:6-1103(-)